MGWVGSGEGWVGSRNFGLGWVFVEVVYNISHYSAAVVRSGFGLVRHKFNLLLSNTCSFCSLIFSC